MLASSTKGAWIMWLWLFLHLQHETPSNVTASGGTEKELDQTGSSVCGGSGETGLRRSG